MFDYDSTYEGWLDNDENMPQLFDEAGCPHCGYWDWDPGIDGMKCQICRAIDEANAKGIIL